MKSADRPDKTGRQGLFFSINMSTSQPTLLLPIQDGKLLKTHGKTFHFASRFFPRKHRQAVISLYAFFRTLDDLVDERPPDWQADQVRRELEAWQDWFERGFSEAAPREPLGTTLVALMQEYALPTTLFLDFLAGLFSDMGCQEFFQFQELYQYCYRVAGTVGMTMAHVLGNTSEQALTAAKDLGIAMQLTNILRDVGRDLSAGRVYLPLAELERFALTPYTLHQFYQVQGKPDERFCALMRAQIARARHYYRAGLHGVWLLQPDCRLPILLAGRLYQGILFEIEQRSYDVLHRRAATSLFTKVREAGVVFLLNLLWRVGEASITPDMDIPYEV